MNRLFILPKGRYSRNGNMRSLECPSRTLKHPNQALVSKTTAANQHRSTAQQDIERQQPKIQFPVLLTPRLHLRPWQITDLPALTTINANPEVMRYFPAPQTEAQTLAFIERQQRQQSERGYCYFAAENRTDGRLIGFIGLSYQEYDAPFTPAADIGWRLHPDYWRKGLATEGARACLDFAFTTLHLPEVVSVAVLQNEPSFGVMEKIGMHRMGEFPHPALTGHPEIERCAWYRALPPGGMVP